MHALKAHVENGRIVVDEPTNLPDGAKLKIVIAEGGDDLDDEERERLHASIRRGIADAKAGRTQEMGEFLDELDAEP
ncbi:MAG TPA: hypothetical protein VGI10_13090 [Polyangiaceae bacterium]|jgi:hypothetical protein